MDGLSVCGSDTPKVLNEGPQKQARNSLARFKKRKSKPTAGSGGSASEGKPWVHASRNSDAGPRVPPAEKAPETAPPPPVDIPDPPVSEAERSEKDRKLNILFWMRIAIAVGAGGAATFIFAGIEGEERRWASIAFMIILFMGTIIVAKNMKMQLPSSDRKKIVTQALGSYVFLYLFTWIVTHTLANLEDVQNGINL